MKTILFISFVIFLLQKSYYCSPAAADGEFSEMSDPAMETDDTKSNDLMQDFKSNGDGLTSQDITLKLTPGKNIILTLSPSSSAAASGVVYTRWGKTSCREGAKLVYEGYAAGGEHTHKGNGANYLCLPKDPEYLSTENPSWDSYLYGAEYETNNKIFSGTQNYNVPCAVCYVADKSSKLQLPAKVSCPESWTREYYGYLMTEYYGHARNAMYECVDQSPDRIAGSSASTNGALFYFVEAVCSKGLPCGPYAASRAITCAICTK